MGGIRAYWDGKQFWSREGNLMETPKWFIHGFPQTPLDGELRMERSTQEILMNIINSKEFDNSKWKEIGFYIFDLPGSIYNYEERFQRLEQLKPFPSHVHTVDCIQCKGNSHLHIFLDSVLKKGGEGIIIRDPHSPYNKEIEKSALKFKVKKYLHKLNYFLGIGLTITCRTFLVK